MRACRAPGSVRAVTAPVSLAVVGAGLIGRRHVEAIVSAGPEVRLAAVVDPVRPPAQVAKHPDVPWYPSLEALLAAGKPDGVILATPNRMHAEGGMQCVSAGVPVLVEKPLATDTASAGKLVDAAERAGIPLLTGHHRRHNPLMRRAKAEIEAGTIGDLVSVNASTWFYKPDDYFDTDWRRMPGAGPAFINLIHDIDLLHFLCGPVDSVFAFESNSVRGNAVEDTCVVALRFECGALGTVNVSDTIVAPWSWELTAGENPAFPETGEDCYLVGGTRGSLELPALRRWHYRDERSWLEPLAVERLTHDPADPLVLQARQFAAVIRGDEAPLVSGRDGLEALRVVEAVKESSASGRAVDIRRSRMEAMA